jgi:hypothetical protein
MFLSIIKVAFELIKLIDLSRVIFLSIIKVAFELIKSIDLN